MMSDSYQHSHRPGGPRDRAVALLSKQGLVVTKLDGSGKGGIAVAIQDELAIPPRFVGIGEKPGDLHYFDRDEFVANLL